MSQDQAQEVLESAVKNQPKKRGCRRGCLVWFLIFVAVYYWVGCHSTPLRVSKETTYALGPMTSDGKRIDYFRAMEKEYYPPEMQTDDNGYRLIVKACGAQTRSERSWYDRKTNKWHTEKIDPEPFRLQVYEKLGLDPSEAPPDGSRLKLGSPYGADYLAKYDKENPPAEGEQTQHYKFSFRPTTMWTLDEFPMLKDWLDENTAGIDLLGKAVRKPVFFIPYVRENENTPIFEAVVNSGPFEIQQLTRDWARAAVARAQYRIGIGDIDGAIDDVVTIFHLGRHVGKQGTLTSYLVGIAIEGVAVSTGIGGNPDFPPTREQIERFVTEINALPPRWTTTQALESERYFTLAAMQDIYWGNMPTSPGGPLPTNLYPYMSRTLDINIFMTRANKIYDALITDSTIDGKTLDEVIKPQWNPLPLLFIRSRTIQIMDTLAALFIPAMRASQDAERRCECTENMQRLTLALLLYEKDHDRLPEGDWREAVRPYLGNNADDCFRCPSCYMPEGYTTYALVRRESGIPTTPNTLLLVEAFPPTKLREGDGTIPEEQVFRYVPGKAPALSATTDGVGSFHGGGYNATLRNGACRFMGGTMEQGKLQKLLDGTAENLP